jgi:hypothetical protein
MATMKRSGPRSASQRRLVAIASIDRRIPFFARSLELEPRPPAIPGGSTSFDALPARPPPPTQVFPVRAVVFSVLLANVRLLLAGSESWTDAKHGSRLNVSQLLPLPSVLRPALTLVLEAGLSCCSTPIELSAKLSGDQEQAFPGRTLRQLVPIVTGVPGPDSRCRSALSGRSRWPWRSGSPAAASQLGARQSFQAIKERRFPSGRSHSSSRSSLACQVRIRVVVGAERVMKF